MPQRTMQMFALCAALCVALPSASFLRTPNSPRKPAGKIKHLLLDIEESLSKAGEDAEMVFATLFTYDGHLESSLNKEIRTLNQTLTSLTAMQANYTAFQNEQMTKATNLDAAAKDSKAMARKYLAGTAEESNKYDNLEGNVRMLISLLRHASVTPQGALLTAETPDARGEPERVYHAIRRLLKSDMALRKAYPSVYDAFLTPSDVGDGSPGQMRYPVVPMSQELLQQTIGVLAGIQQRLERMKAKSLLQFDTLHQRFEIAAVSDGASAEAQLGVRAENEQKAAELTFSIKFTEAVLRADQKFLKALEVHLKSNADQVFAIRDLRQAQLKLLHDLSAIFSSESSIAIGGASFLEVGQTLHSQKPFAGLQKQIETAIHNHGDTHAILMRVKEQLDEDTALDSQNVHDTMSEMEDVLRSVEEDQSKLEEAKRACEAQKFHAKEEADDLQANVALMSAARDHAEKAIKSAKASAQGIQKKATALEKSSKDFAHISQRAIKALEQQSRDRKAIVMAVNKAAQVLSSSVDSESTVQLMKSFVEDISSQEEKEDVYRSAQSAFESAFEQYVQEYTHLLDERHRHYTSSLGVLQLHVSELASDMMAQQQALNTGKQLASQSEGLCQGVLRFYQRHTKTRAELSASLRSILPNMPTVLSNGAIASPGE